MRMPPTVTRGGPWPPRVAATFRFGGPQRRHLLRTEDGMLALWRAARDAANTNVARKGGQICGYIRAGVTPARRMAEKRPPAQGEMEHVHVIYGGFFADGPDPGSA